MYKDAVDQEYQSAQKTDELISQDDLKDLPDLLKHYMIKVGVIGKPRVKIFSVKMTGEMKLDQTKDYEPIEAEQHTFTASGTRLFYITMKYKGIKVNGLHHYHSNDAFMKIKILDTIKVVDQSGPEMLKAETVTYFNDLCIMAPGALLDENIVWETLNDNQVKGTLTKHNQEVSAILTFNASGMLENFISEDRMAIDQDGKMISIPWSTPMSHFGQVGDYYLADEGQAIWHYDKPFAYIKLKINEVKINDFSRH